MDTYKVIAKTEDGRSYEFEMQGGNERNSCWVAEKIVYFLDYAYDEGGINVLSFNLLESEAKDNE